MKIPSEARICRRQQARLLPATDLSAQEILLETNPNTICQPVWRLD